MKYLRFKLLLLLLTFFVASNGQDLPWKKYGLNPKVLTLSNGKYKEFHDMETVVQIGSVYFNTETRKIVGFVKKDTVNKELNIRPDLVSRWFNPDPLAEEYSSWSPYNYVMNILFYTMRDHTWTRRKNIYGKKSNLRNGCNSFVKFVEMIPYEDILNNYFRKR